MARRKSVNLFWPIMIAALVMAGCMNLVNSVFGDEETAVKAAPVPSPGPLPNLARNSLDQAKSQLESRGLRLVAEGIGGRDYCFQDAYCFIYRMTPKAGTVVKPGDEVQVRFVTGPEWGFYKDHRRMPKVVGWSEDRAKRVFDLVSEVVETDEKEVSTVPKGESRVIGQSPKAGTRLRIGQTIKLVIGYNYGWSTSGGGGGGGGVDTDVHHDSHESRFCSRRWWC
ncbi:PASTA domain-containing protein [Microbispora sp. GKU 823]|uniref:PASTA domain-containing protein n=1 Tax=Microbispora sp. GKU 823 TaxID=1652100 RepID=UPI0009A34FB9|nr:PASTA domain-containing protein [Microbispora sp. GKU 823]OPG12520.1 hypothetical protein B1L11_14145 [Microbispora sp. GKU 823]